MSHERDAVLLERYLCSGDEVALRVLFDRWREDGLRVATRFVGGDDQFASEAVDDVFLDLASGAAHYDPARPFGPFFMAIVKRKAIDIARREAARRKHESCILDDVPEARDVGTPDIVEGLGRDELHARVWALPVTLREVAARQYVYGFAERSTAEELGLSRAEVRKVSGLAIECLRDRWFPRCPYYRYDRGSTSA